MRLMNTTVLVFDELTLQSLFLHDVSYGAITQLYAGTIPDGKSLNGKVRPVCIALLSSIMTMPCSCVVPHPMGTNRQTPPRYTGSRSREEAMGVPGGSNQGRLTSRVSSYTR